jgi:hypothetical protein
MFIESFRRFIKEATNSKGKERRGLVISVARLVTS